MNTPKTLTDLKFQDNVLHLTNSQIVDTEARRFFKEVFGSDEQMKLRRLFTEDNKIVWEAFQDSGSVDYLYLVK